MKPDAAWKLWNAESFFGRCRTETQARMPSDRSRASGSWISFFFTQIPVYSDAQAQSPSGPGIQIHPQGRANNEPAVVDVKITQSAVIKYTGLAV